MSGLRCVGFDGRIDINRFLVDKEGYILLEFVKKGHYLIVSYLRNICINHVASQAGGLSDIAEELILIFTERNLDQSPAAIVCYGTNVDTGNKHGFILSLEEQLFKLLQLFVCLLYCIKLPPLTLVRNWIIH